jgi:exonuclease SbcC
MIPIHLTISGFLSYQDKVELDLSPIHLACISGANGAGKSSLLDAITWVLFGQARRRDDALINSFAKSAEVQLDFEYERSLYRVQRTKPRDKSTILEFHIHEAGGGWRALTERTISETQKRIEGVLRLSYDTFINASFFLQGKADLFAQQNPTRRKEILSDILGLEAWEVYRDRAAEQRKRHESELAGLDSVLGEIRTELDEEEGRRYRLKLLEENLGRITELRAARESGIDNLRRLKATLDEQGRLVEILRGQYEKSRNRLELQEKELTNLGIEEASMQQKLTQADAIHLAHQEWQQVRKELEGWDVLAANFHQHEIERTAPSMVIEREKTRLETEVRGLMELESQARQLEPQIPAGQLELEATNQALKELQQRLAEREQLSSEQQSLQQTQADRVAENRRLKAEMDELKERINRLVEVEGADCPLCGQPLSPDDRSALLAGLEAQGKSMGDRYRENKKAVDEGEQRLTELGRQINALQQLDTELRTKQRAHDNLVDRLAQMQQQLSTWASGGALNLKEYRRKLQADDYAHDARAELSRVNAALKELGYDAATHDAARRREQAGRTSELALSELKAAEAALAPLQQNIRTRQIEREANQVETSRMEQDFSITAAKHAADSTAMPDLRQHETELFKLIEQERQAQQEVGAARQQVEVLKIQKKRLKEKEAERESLTKSISRLKFLEKSFGKDGVPALLIEQALPEIQQQADEILSRLSDGRMSVRFITQRDYKEKGREDKKETLEIIISDAAGEREYELFSGGEAFRVNFAIRLALAHVLAQRAGARLQTLVIDEGFGSQDSEGRQRLVEAINTVQNDYARVLVITHLEELKDSFPSRIEVEKTPSGSTVRVLA